MAQDKSVNQTVVNDVWSGVWRSRTAILASSEFSNRNFIEAYRALRPLVPDSAGAILETGTGSGRFSVALARDMPNAHIIATDIVPEALEAASVLARDALVTNVKFELADLMKLPFQNDSFDVVLSDAVIQHMPEDLTPLREMVRVLRPGGTLIVAVVNKWSVHKLIRCIQSALGVQNEYGNERFYSHHRLREIIEDAGALVETQSGFYPAYGIYRLKKHASFFGIVGRILNRVSRWIDSVTGDFISSRFGFEIVIAARKPAGSSRIVR